MKMFHSLFALLLLTLAFSGCSSCPCKEKAAEIPAPETTQAVAAPATPVVTEAPASGISEEPVEEKVPAAVLK